MLSLVRQINYASAQLCPESALCLHKELHSDFVIFQQTIGHSLKEVKLTNLLNLCQKDLSYLSQSTPLTWGIRSLL